MKKPLIGANGEDLSDANWKKYTPFVPPVPLTEEQLEPQLKQFEEWAGSVEGAPTKEDVKKLFIDGHQAGRERGFEEGYAKAGKDTAQHFTFARNKRSDPTDLNGAPMGSSEQLNADLLTNELNAVISEAAILPDKVKLDALFNVLEARFGVKIDRGGEGR